MVGLDDQATGVIQVPSDPPDSVSRELMTAMGWAHQGRKNTHYRCGQRPHPGQINHREMSPRRTGRQRQTPDARGATGSSQSGHGIRGWDQLFLSAQHVGQVKLPDEWRRTVDVTREFNAIIGSLNVIEAE